MSKPSNRKPSNPSKSGQNWLQKMVQPVRNLKRSMQSTERKEWNPESYIWKNETRGGEAPRPKSYRK